MRLLAIALLVPAAAFAGCPSVPDTADAQAAAHTILLNAESEAEARAAETTLWQIYFTAPDKTAQDLLDAGIARREAYDLAGAEEFFDTLIEYCPDYPEGYNQRAFARFLREDYDGALEDIDLVLKDMPLHFGALSGRALTLMQAGRFELGQEALREALEVDPWLRERAMLVVPLDPPGDEL